MYSILVPIVEKLAASPKSQDNLRLLITALPKYCSREIKHEFKDVALNHIKLLGIIAVKARAMLQKIEFEEGQVFIAFLMQRVQSFLKDKFSVYVKKEVFNLLSLVADLPVRVEGNTSWRHEKSRTTVFDVVEPSLSYVKSLHFPVSARELKPQSNEEQNFQVIVQAFLNLAIIT